jgi:hypothetical protein
VDHTVIYLKGLEILIFIFLLKFRSDYHVYSHLCSLGLKNIFFGYTGGSLYENILVIDEHKLPFQPLCGIEIIMRRTVRKNTINVDEYEHLSMDKMNTVLFLPAGKIKSAVCQFVCTKYF